MTRCLPLVALVLLAGCRAQIHHGLDEKDANEIVTALVGRGFDAKKVPEKGKKPTFAIDLDEPHATDALRVLTELKLPRPPRTTTRDVTASTGLIETPAAEKLRQLEALEGDIEQTLESLDGVSSAGVELVVPAPARPGQPVVPSKASALLRVTPDAFDRLQSQRAALKELIAGSVDGLKADDVSLMLDTVTARAAATVPVNDEVQRLKAIAMVLAVLMTTLGLALAAVSIRNRSARRKLRTAPREPKTPAHPAPSMKPIISPSAQKRVA